MTRILVPKHLSVEMQKFFRNIMQNFNLESHHILILVKACELFDRAEQARQQVDQEGATLVDRYGSPKLHPCCKLEIDCKNSARLLLRELGLDLEPAETGRGPRLY